MGWDAYAEPFDYDNPPQAFKDAVERVKEIAGAADVLLERGGLDTSSAGQFLHEATGRSIYDEHGWSPEEVKTYAKNAMWDDHFVEDDRRWAYESAKAFLETAAELGLSVRFSW